MCYRGTDSTEIDAEETGMRAYEEPGRFGERGHHKHRESTSEPVRTDANTQSVIGRIKTLFTA
jgi:hypothetical protein